MAAAIPPCTPPAPETASFQAWRKGRAAAFSLAAPCNRFRPAPRCRVCPRRTVEGRSKPCRTIAVVLSEIFKKQVPGKRFLRLLSLFSDIEFLFQISVKLDAGKNFFLSLTVLRLIREVFPSLVDLDYIENEFQCQYIFCKKFLLFSFSLYEALSLKTVPARTGPSSRLFLL